MSKKNILFIDDDTFILELLRKSFEHDVFEMHFFNHPEDALKFLDDHYVDVVVADFSMPKIKGKQLFTNIKFKQPECACIVLSGVADINDIIGLLNEKLIDGFLKKPWKYQELKDLVLKLTVS